MRVYEACGDGQVQSGEVRKGIKEKAQWMGTVPFKWTGEICFGLITPPQIALSPMMGL